MARQCSPQALLAGLRVQGFPHTLESFNCPLMQSHDLIADRAVPGATPSGLANKSLLMIGDCFERRSVTHFCVQRKREVFNYGGDGDDTSLACHIPVAGGVFTVGAMHIFGISAPPFFSETGPPYSSVEMASLPTAERIAVLACRFQRNALEGRAPTIVTLGSYKWDTALWAESYDAAAAAKANPHAKKLSPLFPPEFNWYYLEGEPRIRDWLRSATELTASLAQLSALEHSQLYWLTHYVPVEEFAKSTSKAFNGLRGCRRAANGDARVGRKVAPASGS